MDKKTVSGMTFSLCKIYESIISFCFKINYFQLRIRLKSFCFTLVLRFELLVNITAKKVTILFHIGFEGFKKFQTEFTSSLSTVEIR